MNEKNVTFSDSLGASGPIPDGLFRETLLPGIAFFSGGPYETAVITPSERESTLKTVPLSEMRHVFDSPVSLLTPDEEPGFQIARLRRGTDLAGISLLVALILLTAEFILGSDLSGFRKRKGDV